MDAMERDNTLSFHKTGAVSIVDKALSKALAELREKALQQRCHAACYDEDGHTDGCFYDDAESQIP